ncbi:MAG: alpha/beta fold hydrolase [Myxococcota bacterium]|nr:alpha/beta fold hydrolase [Myxococcota bacterium]
MVYFPKAQPSAVALERIEHSRASLTEGLKRFGRWLNRAYHAVDPALRRHLAEVPLLGGTLLASGKTPSLKLIDDRYRAVIFIHGFGGHRGNFIPMETYFRCLGRKRVLSLGFEDKSSMEVMAWELRRIVKTVLEENVFSMERPIDIVAHSMGGILARVALETPEFAGKINHLITLATPHSGTELARYLHTKKAQSLRPNSHLLNGLNRQLPWASNENFPTLTCFWTPQDMVLLPPESACVSGVKNIACPGCTHLGFLLKPQVWEAVYQQLSSDSIS